MRAVAVGLVLLATPALAQDPPLTTLLVPHPSPLTRVDPLAGPDRLFEGAPLTNENALGGEGSLSNPRPVRRPRAGDLADPADDPVAAANQVHRPAAGCDPQTEGSRRPGAPNVAAGGSGPGEYARFVPAGRTGAAKPPARAARPSAAVPGDRPLYGGVDRPLWNQSSPSTPRETPSDGAAASDAPAAPATASAGVDQPLWGEPAAPCDADPATRRAGAARPPSETLLFGTGPAR